MVCLVRTLARDFGSEPSRFQQAQVMKARCSWRDLRPAGKTSKAWPDSHHGEIVVGYRPRDHRAHPYMALGSPSIPGCRRYVRTTNRSKREDMDDTAYSEQSREISSDYSGVAMEDGTMAQASSRGVPFQRARAHRHWNIENRFHLAPQAAVIHLCSTAPGWPNLPMMQMVSVCN